MASRTADVGGYKFSLPTGWVDKTTYLFGADGMRTKLSIDLVEHDPAGTAQGYIDSNVGSIKEHLAESDISERGTMHVGSMEGSFVEIKMTRGDETQGRLLALAAKPKPETLMLFRLQADESRWSQARKDFESMLASLNAR